MRLGRITDDGNVQTHTILGSKTQRGLMQLALDVIFRSLGTHILDPAKHTSLEQSIIAADASEASILSATAFLESVYADLAAPSRGSSRAQTPMIVGSPSSRIPLASMSANRSSDLQSATKEYNELYMRLTIREDHSRSLRMVNRRDSVAPATPSLR
jgi:hypothetical protein